MTRPHRSARALFILCSLGATLFAIPADAALGHAREGAVSFFATGPAGLKIEGKTHELSVTEQGGKIHFVVPLAGLDTGISLRNRHMREKYLEVSKYPNAELVVDRAALKTAADGAATGGTVTGTMSLHGQSKPVSLTYKAKRSGATYDLEGSVHLDIRQFGIQIPSYMGVTVKPDVDVTVHAKVDDT